MLVTLQRFVSVDVVPAISVHCKVSEVLIDVAPVDRRLDGGLDDFYGVRVEGDVTFVVVLAVEGVGDDVFVVVTVEHHYDWVIYPAFLADSFYDTCAVNGTVDFLVYFEHGFPLEWLRD